MIQDQEGLRALVQASVLEIHPWGATVSAPDRPDRLVFDLDPGDGVAWGDIVAGALEVRERMSATGLASFVKTTGGKGLHVVVPIEPKACWDEAKAFMKRIASEMAKDTPELYVATVSKKARDGRIYLDYLRNQRGSDRRCGLLDPGPPRGARIRARRLGRASIARVRLALRRRQPAEPPLGIWSRSLGGGRTRGPAVGDC